MDEKLKAPLAEIRAIIKKHDIGGLIILGSRTHTDFGFELSPSWSCAKLEQDDQGRAGIRFLSKLVDYPSRAEQKKHIEATTGLLMGLLHVLTRNKDDLETVIAALGSRFDISHWDREESGEYESDQ
jgi:hypothetical protein